VVRGETCLANLCASRRSLDIRYTAVTAEYLRLWNGYSLSNPTLVCHVLHAYWTLRFEILRRDWLQNKGSLGLQLPPQLPLCAASNPLPPSAISARIRMRTPCVPSGATTSPFEASFRW